METRHEASGTIDLQCKRVTLRVEWSDGVVEEYVGEPPREVSYSIDLQPDRETWRLKLEMLGVTRVTHDGTEGLIRPS